MVTLEIKTPLDGKVFQPHIITGDKVEEDEEILVIDTMKMETPLFAPCDGVVKEVRIKDGDEMPENNVLAIIEEKHIEA